MFAALVVSVVAEEANGTPLVFLQTTDGNDVAAQSPTMLEKIWFGVTVFEMPVCRAYSRSVPMTVVTGARPETKVGNDTVCASAEPAQASHAHITRSAIRTIFIVIILICGYPVTSVLPLLSTKGTPSSVVRVAIGPWKATQQVVPVGLVMLMSW